MFIRKKTVDSGIANLSKYDDDEVMELAKELAKKVGAENYSIYENNYKYAKLDYKDPTYGYYICEYVTVMNREIYTFTFQSTAAYTDYEYEEIKKIVDSVRFDVDTSLKEKGKEKESIWGDVAIKALSGAAIGGTVGAVMGIVSKKKKDKNAPKNDQEIPVNTTEIQE